MKSASMLTVVWAALTLSACGAGRYDCSSADTQDLIRELLADGNDELVLNSVLMETRVEGIVTEEMDKDVGWYACRAEIKAKLPNGKTSKADLYYEVSQVESADADLEVAIDKAAGERFANVIRHSLNTEN